MSFDGIILVNKKKGETSHDAVYALRKKFSLDKTGHTGTLDPLAEGLLVVMVNEATKAGRFIPDDKEYIAEITFGAATDTDDAEGKIIKECAPPPDLKAFLTSVLPKYTGTISQVPPAYSAISKDGVRAYKLARQGKEVKLEPRLVTVHAIEVLSAEGSKAVLKINCSPGTYIRSIARDLGADAGSCAFMSALKRTKLGPYSCKNARTVDEITDLGSAVIPLNEALAHMPLYEVPRADSALLSNGNPLKNYSGMNEGYIRLVLEGKLIAIGRIEKDLIMTERKFTI